VKVIGKLWEGYRSITALGEQTEKGPPASAGSP